MMIMKINLYMELIHAQLSPVEQTKMMMLKNIIKLISLK